MPFGFGKKNVDDESDNEASESKGPKLSWWRTAIIDMVNPKFKAYNRPLFLAIVVGFCTYSLVAITAGQLIGGCEVFTFTGVQRGLNEMYDRGAMSCFWFVRPLADASGGNAKNCIPHFASADDYCPVEKETAGSPCASSDENSMVTGLYEICPDLSTMTGASLGYATIIEFGITFLVIVLCTPCGCVKRIKPVSLFDVANFFPAAEAGKDIAMEETSINP